MKIWGEIKENGSDGPTAAADAEGREVWCDDMDFGFAGNVSVILQLI